MKGIAQKITELESEFDEHRSVDSIVTSFDGYSKVDKGLIGMRSIRHKSAPNRDSMAINNVISHSECKHTERERDGSLE